MSSENTASTLTDDKNIQTPEKIKETKQNASNISLLNRKRKLKSLENNYLVRRLIQQKPRDKKEIEENEYEKINNIYSLLMSFDWKNAQSNHLSKNYSIFQRLRANSFWFYFSSSYFPFNSNQLLESYEYLPEIIQKYLIEKNGENYGKKNTLSKTKTEKIIFDVLYYLNNCKLNSNNNNLYTNTYTNIYNNNSSNNLNNLNLLNNYLEDLQKKYEKIKKINEDRLINRLKYASENEKDKFYILTENYDSNLTYSNDLFMDTSYHSRKIKKFTELCIKKNESRNKICNEKDPDDVLCQVCNDGDYEDDNLIVYCSLCKLTVHQKCYGITVLPKGNWYCHSCLIYKDPNILKNTSCILCSCKGGAMKPCSLKKGTIQYNWIMEQRKNNESISNNNKLNKQNFSFTNNNKQDKKLDNNLRKLSFGSDIINIDNDEDSNKPNEDINEKIANEHAWVHLSCALWTPEIYIEEFEKKEKIKGFDKINKKDNNFKKTCDICLKTGYVSIIQCEKCSLQFHPECARRNNYLMEMSENQNEYKYHIFCHRDAPHKLIKTRELKKQREKDDIKQFSEIIEKNIEIHNKLFKGNQILGIESKAKKYISNISNNNTNINNIRKVSKKEIDKIGKKKLIELVRNLAIDLSNLNIIINVPSENKNEYSINIKINKISLSYLDTQLPSKFPWFHIRNYDDTLQSIRPYDIFNKYLTIIRSDDEYNKEILKIKKIKKEDNKEINKVKDNTLYCVCKNRYTPNDDNKMIYCSGSEYGKCDGNGWFHYKCLGLTQEDVDKIDLFYCESCKKKYGDKIFNKNDCSNINDDVSPNGNNIGFCGASTISNSGIETCHASSPVHSEGMSKYGNETEHSIATKTV